MGLGGEAELGGEGVSCLGGTGDKTKRPPARVRESLVSPFGSSPHPRPTGAAVVITITAFCGSATVANPPRWKPFPLLNAIVAARCVCGGLEDDEEEAEHGEATPTMSSIRSSGGCLLSEGTTAADASPGPASRPTSAPEPSLARFCSSVRAG